MVIWSLCTVLVALVWSQSGLAEAVAQTPSSGPDVVSPLLAYGPLGIAAILLVLFVRQQLAACNKEREEWQQRYITLSDKTMNEYVPAGAKLVETAERVLKFGTELELLSRKSS